MIVLLALYIAVNLKFIFILSWRGRREIPDMQIVFVFFIIDCQIFSCIIRLDVGIISDFTRTFQPIWLFTFFKNWLF